MKKLSILSTTRSGHNFIKEVIESWILGIDITVLENCPPENVYAFKLDACSPRVIVIREFKNFLASSIKSYGDIQMRLKRPIDELYKLLHESIEHKIKMYRAILKEAEDKEYYDADVVISYDDFCDSEEYRRVICEKLKGVYTEDRLGFVSSEGDGSSWDQLTMQGEGQKMKTRDRHEQILETKWGDVYIEILKEDEDLVNEYNRVKQWNG